MAHIEINRSTEPVRLFKSDFLEFFTHVHPAVIVILWAPVIVYFFARAIVSRTSGAFLYIPLGFLIGLFFWTLTEYVVHRFVFHFRPRAPWQERVSFLFHGIHHLQPQCKTRLVMPPAVSIPLALLSYGLMSLILGILRIPFWINPLFSGFVTGYLAYDLIHYATHHSAMHFRAFKYLKRYHMLHHFKSPDRGFGVSSPLWDIVFGTRLA
jgi:sterol desaturase/sphingolipid hydroxylase (fatty acid hydroxylase superfamily)